jgi:hypothetical protein
VEPLLVPFWIDGRLCTENVDTIVVCKERVKTQLATLRADIKRMLNPTPFKVILTLFLI